MLYRAGYGIIVFFLKKEDKEGEGKEGQTRPFCWLQDCRMEVLPSNEIAPTQPVV
jgi:hypothetical protein